MTAPIYHCAATLAANPAVIAVVVFDKDGPIVDEAAYQASDAWVTPVRYIFHAHNNRRAKMTHVAMDNAACIRLLTDDTSGETVAVVYAYAPGPLSKSLPKIMRAILRNRNKARVKAVAT